MFDSTVSNVLLVAIFVVGSLAIWELIKLYKSSTKLWTLEEMKADERLLLACADKVYDVSSNAQMYGPGTTYNVFIGKDASVALAKMQFDEEFFNTSEYHWSQLNEEETKILGDWIRKFDGKYPIVGRLNTKVSAKSD